MSRIAYVKGSVFQQLKRSSAPRELLLCATPTEVFLFAKSEEGSGKISIGTENNYGFQNSQTSSLSVSNRTIPSLYSKSKFQVKTDEKKMY